MVADAKELPQIFVKEAKNAATPAFDEKADHAGRQERRRSSSGVDLTHMPPLKGRTATVMKDTALELLATDRRRSAAGVLADRPRPDGGVRVGRQGSLGAPTGSSGAATGRSSPPSCARSSGSGRPRPRSRSRRGRSTGTREPWPSRWRRGTRTGRHRDLLRPAAQVHAADGAPRDVALRQVAPGRYEAALVADASAAAHGQSCRRGRGVCRRHVPRRASGSRRRIPLPAARRSAAALDRCSHRWRLAPGPEALASAAADRRTERRPVWPALIAARALPLVRRSAAAARARVRADGRLVVSLRC